MATYLTSLYDVLKGPDYLTLTEVQIEVFNLLKRLLVNYKVLRLPDFKRPFFITLSFSKLGYGAVLM